MINKSINLLFKVQNHHGTWSQYTLQNIKYNNNNIKTILKHHRNMIKQLKISLNQSIE